LTEVRSGLVHVVFGRAVLGVFRDQAVRVAQTGAGADRALPALLDDLSAGGHLALDGLVQVGVEHGGGGPCRLRVLVGVELEDEDWDTLLANAAR
jgi:hypothetical protein